MRLLFFNHSLPAGRECLGDYYEIPIGCLRARDLENVFVAGRCISAEPRAIASARVIGTCLGMGWAAGTAAPFQAQGKPIADARQPRNQPVPRVMLNVPFPTPPSFKS